MRRALLGVVGAICLMSLSGCVGVSATTHRNCNHDRVAVVGGRVFVVDTACGSAREIDLSQAEPFAPSPGDH